jgi:hypothetical protein
MKAPRSGHWILQPNGEDSAVQIDIAEDPIQSTERRHDRERRTGSVCTGF